MSTSNKKTLPNQTYDDTTAILIGRKFDLEQSSPFVDRFSLGDPEETPNPIPTITVRIESSATTPRESTITKSSTGQPAPTNGTVGSYSESDEGGKTNIGAIVGGTLQSLDSNDDWI